ASRAGGSREHRRDESGARGSPGPAAPSLSRSTGPAHRGRSPRPPATSAMERRGHDMSIYSRRTRREILRDSTIAGGALAFGGPLLAACGTSSTSSGGGIASSGKPTRKNTLYIGGFQWGPATNFNPVGPNSAWPTAQQSGMMHVYEAL